MRRKTAFKSVDADTKIMDWFEDNPEYLNKIRESYEQHYNNIIIGNYSVNRNTYGGTTFGFKVKYPGDQYGREYSVSMPLADKESISLTSHKETAFNKWTPILSPIWGEIVPNHNRKLDNWMAAVLENRYHLDRWDWILGTPQRVVRDIIQYITTISRDEYYQEKAKEIESQRALERISALQKDFRHLTPDHWHTIVDLALVASIHS